MLWVRSQTGILSQGMQKPKKNKEQPPCDTAKKTVNDHIVILLKKLFLHKRVTDSIIFFVISHAHQSGRKNTNQKPV